MAEANNAQGFLVHEGLYRMPDLLTEEQTIEYFKETYGVKLTFEHLDPTAAGESESVLGPTGQSPTESKSTVSTRKTTK